MHFEAVLLALPAQHLDLEVVRLVLVAAVCCCDIIKALCCDFPASAMT